MKLNLKSDHQTVSRRGGVVHVLVELQAPALPQEESAARKPLNAALVIDVSGSMAGPPLAAARTAGVEIVDGLGDEERLSVVSFASETRTHVDAIACDSRGRERAQAEIARLRTRGCTNLADGWLTGARCVAQAMEELPGHQSHVVVLSDGRANRGLCDPAELAEHAGELRRRGLFTSTVGVGDHYSPVQLEAIAEHGGGRMHDAEHPHEIVEVVLAELGELRRTAAQDVEIDVQAPEGTGVECLGTYAGTPRPQGLRIAVGSLLAEARRTVLLRVTFPADLDSEASGIFLAPSWHAPGESDRTRGEPVRLALPYADVVPADSPEGDVAERVAELWQSWIVSRAMALHQEDDRETAARIVEDEIERFELYVRGLTRGAELADELRRLSSRLRERWSPRAAKEVALYHRKRARGERDHRSQGRGPWTDYMPG